MKKFNKIILWNLISLVGLLSTFEACQFGNEPDDVTLYPAADETTFTLHFFRDTADPRNATFIDTVFQQKPDNFDPDKIQESYSFSDTIVQMTFESHFGIDSSIAVTRIIRKTKEGDVRDTLEERSDYQLSADTLVITKLAKSALEAEDGLGQALDFDTLYRENLSTYSAESDTLPLSLEYSYNTAGDSLSLIYDYVTADDGDYYSIDTGSQVAITSFWRLAFQDRESMKFFIRDTFAFMDTTAVISPETEVSFSLDWRFPTYVLDSPDSLEQEGEFENVFESIHFESIHSLQEENLSYPDSQFVIPGMKIMGDSTAQLDTTLSHSPWNWQWKSDEVTLSIKPDSMLRLGSWSNTFRVFADDRTIYSQAYQVNRFYNDFYPKGDSLHHYWNVPNHPEVFSESQGVISLTAVPGSDSLNYHYYARINSRFQLKGDFSVSLQVDLPSTFSDQYGTAFFVSYEEDPISIFAPEYEIHEFTEISSSAGFVINGKFGVNNIKAFSYGYSFPAIRNIPGDPFLHIRRKGSQVFLSYRTIDEEKEVLISKPGIDVENMHIYLMSLSEKPQSAPFTVEYKRFQIEQGELIFPE